MNQKAARGTGGASKKRDTPEEEESTDSCNLGEDKEEEKETVGIPDICYRRHRRRLCKFFLPGVNFFQTEREKFTILLYNLTHWVQCNTVYNLSCHCV